MGYGCFMSWDMGIQTFLGENDEHEIHANICCVSDDVVETVGLLNMLDHGRD